MWRARAVVLPDGTAPAEIAITDGHFTTSATSDGPTASAPLLPGGWLLPGGLVDAHVHLTMNFGRVMAAADGSDALVAANSAAHVRTGVLACRDAGAAWGGLPRPQPGGPRLQRAGSIMAPAGRGYPHVCRTVEADDLIACALQDVEAGATWVKIMADFPGPDGNWYTAPPNYPRTRLSELVREVHAVGARVMAHSTGLAAGDLIAAGVDAIEHGMALTRDQVEAMAQQQIAWTATLATAHKHIGALAQEPTPVGAYLRAQFDRLRDLFPFAVTLGVPLLAGSDELGIGGLASELRYLEHFGLSRPQALAAASTTARRWLRFPHVRSSDSTNVVSDAVLYEADPRHDLDVLRHPVAVVMNGQVVVGP